MYQQIAGFDNVQLAPLSYDSFKLIDAAQAVAVVTGTAALESIMRSKHALVFGNVWFQACEGILLCKTVEDIQHAIQDITTTTISQEKILAFFKTLETLSRPAYLNPGNKPYTPISKEENIHNLTQLLLQHEKNEHD